MSTEIESIKDPGLPAHVHRKADTDPAAANRAERQVAAMFGISALGTEKFNVGTRTGSASTEISCPVFQFLIVTSGSAKRP